MTSCRRHLRYTLSRDTIYTATIFSCQKTQTVDIVNISSGGIFIGIPEPPPSGARIELCFSFPGFEENCHIPCVVRWTKARGAGLEFVRLTKTATVGVNHVIQTLRTAPSVP
jgi:hypothetical protein